MPLRTTAAVLVGKAALVAARLRGGGSAFPGLVAERIDPAFLTHTLREVRHGIVVVSGTNGKTTTTRMLVALLRAHGRRVFTNPTGSNFTRGVISSMLRELTLGGRLDADLAVVELDEAHALRFCEAVPPTHALLLNVARDQLDRFAEIDHTARLLASLAEQTTDGLVVNRDDSFVARIAPAALDRGLEVRWFGVHDSIADRLPELLEQDVRFGEDFVAPEPTTGDGLLRPLDERTFEIVFGAAGAGPTDGGGAATTDGIAPVTTDRAASSTDGAASHTDGAASHTGASVTVGPVTLQQRGLAAMINAAAATTTARLLLGDAFDADTAARALADVRPPFGRGEVIMVDGQPLELVLVKNPAGFTVALGTYGGTPVATMIAINDNDADGRDVSWLYDVSFASLRERGVAWTSGIRAWDMALRLEYDDVAVGHVETDLTGALDAFLAAHRDEPKRIFCTYTAMMSLRRTLAARHGLADFGEEG